MLMGGHRDTTTQMTDNQIQVLIALAYLVSKTSGNGALVQGVPDTDTIHQGRTADTRIIVEFIHHTWVGNKRATTRNGLCNIIGYQTSKVTRVVMHRNTIIGIIEHLLVNLIYTTGDGLHQTAATNNSFELHCHIHMG